MNKNDEKIKMFREYVKRMAMRTFFICIFFVVLVLIFLYHPFFVENFKGLLLVYMFGIPMMGDTIATAVSIWEIKKELKNND